MKKAISDVVATVLIILITVAAVVIIWTTIVPMVKNMLVGKNSCMKVQSDLTIGSEGYTCVNKSSPMISLQLSRGIENYELVGVKVQVYIKGNSYEEDIRSGLPQDMQTLVYNISYHGTDPSVNFSNAEKIEIAPIIKEGQVETACDVSGNAQLLAC